MWQRLTHSLGYLKSSHPSKNTIYRGNNEFRLILYAIYYYLALKQTLLLPVIASSPPNFINLHRFDANKSILNQGRGIRRGWGRGGRRGTGKRVPYFFSFFPLLAPPSLSPITPVESIRYDSMRYAFNENLTVRNMIVSSTGRARFWWVHYNNNNYYYYCC